MATHDQAVAGDVVSQALQWVRHHRHAVTAATVMVVILGGGAWFIVSAKARKEAFAAGALRDAQAAVSAGNLALATSDLARLAATYRGTAAAEEAAVLLGQVRLSRGEPDSAIQELGAFVQTGPRPRFLAAAYNLLGAALENAGRTAEAAEAYEKAASSWPYDYLRAQALLEAGRTFRAVGDTARAASSYERVLHDYGDTPSAVEAKVRLAEIRRGDVPTS